jgi:uncharacterized membrane protein YeaQ/YmgE (transglycosylase-associated protein family)
MIVRILELALVGLVVGGLGRLLHPGIDAIPIWLTMVIGLVASLIAGLVFQDLIGFVLAIVIAALLVGLVGRAYERRARAQAAKPS